MHSLLSTAYWPNLHYFFYVLNSESTQIEQFENYQKQSFRNRSQILSANGVLDLSIPIHKKRSKEITKNIQISYKENWQIKHWRAITSAYKNSPYFGFFEEDIKPFYIEKQEFLLDYNDAQLGVIFKILKIKGNLSRSCDYQKDTNGRLDLRAYFLPKADFKKDVRVTRILEKPYYQTFGVKYGFVPNLSILDLLFNTGPEAFYYL